MRSQDKAVKLNDLMNFSENFKLNTRIPVDLIPTFAKIKEAVNSNTLLYHYAVHGK
jgi:hypothetical protein